MANKFQQRKLRKEPEIVEQMTIGKGFQLRYNAPAIEVEYTCI